MGTHDLFGRDHERGAIDAALSGVRRGGSAALLLRGDAGIGKSALLDYAAAQATDLRVLRTSGYESESEIAFAGLSDIVRPIVDRLRLLPDPQRRALESMLALGPATDGGHFTICTATLGVLAAAAEEGGVVVLVDDAHWLDASSAEALRFTARRLHGEGIAMLLAARPIPGHEHGDAGIPTLQLDGLDDEAATALLERSTGHDIPPDRARQLLEVTAGNPLALTEIPRALDGDLLAPSAPLPAGATLERVFERRLDALPDQTRAALAVAAADQAGALAPIVLALGRAGLGIAALGPAEQRGVVAVDGERIVFQHPLLRSTAYHRTPLATRCDAHRALADAYASFTGDQAADAAAWHLATATLAPDDDVADVLHETGERAQRRGAYVEAARAMERAATLTVDPTARGRRMTLAAKAWQLAGRLRRSGELLTRALTLTGDPIARAEVQHLRGYVRMWREAPVGVSGHLEHEANAVAAVAPDRAARMLADAAVPPLMTADIEGALAITRQAVRVAGDGRTSTRRAAGTMHAVALTIRGDRRSAAALVDEVADWLTTQSPVRRAQETIFATMTLMWLGDFPGAHGLLDPLIAACRRSSALGVLPFALGLASAIDLRTGRWQQGEARATESVRLAEETHQANIYGVFFLGHLLAAMGRREEVERTLARADELAGRYGVDCIPLYTGAARGLLDLGAGDVDGALGHLRPVREQEDARGVGEPAVLLADGDLAEALARAGHADEAADVIDGRLRPPAEAGSRWAAWTIERVSGLLDGSRAATDHFERAHALHEQLAWPFERARTALCHGEVLRRTGRRAEARVQFRAALATFDQLGAAPWAVRARAELGATGERVTSHRVNAALHLTPQELQVALVVAEGATNAEAAASLFLSTKTIEYHLSKIYRKAGLSSRDQLAELVEAARA
jgi:DNA-binding CsgD family transcriptional regulator